MSDTPARRWIRPREAADIYGCHLQTIYSGLLCGDLPGAKLKGLGWLLDRVALELKLEREIARRAAAAKGRKKNAEE